MTGAARGAGGKATKKNISRSVRAGLIFPVGRIHRMLRKGNYAPHIGVGAPVFLAGVLEYLTAEVLELAGKAAQDNKRTRIIPRHLQLAVRNDDELTRLLADVIISEGGVMPNINPTLLPRKTSGGPGVPEKMTQQMKAAKPKDSKPAASQPNAEQQANDQHDNVNSAESSASDQYDSSSESEEDNSENTDPGPARPAAKSAPKKPAASSQVKKKAPARDPKKKSAAKKPFQASQQASQQV